MNENRPSVLPKLNATHRRVFGVLIEKSLTTPAGYPMTLNALVTGCNQLTCRDPVMQLTETEIARALHDMEIMSGGSLARQAAVDRTARSTRFEHLAESRFGWDRRERAVMAELLLRGPQTSGELKTNASRMAPFDDLQTMLNLLDSLARHEPPYVHELARQPGQSTIRFDHLLYDQLPPIAPVLHAPAAHAAPLAPAGPQLEERLSRLEAELTALTRQVEELRRLIPTPKTEGQA